MQLISTVLSVSALLASTAYAAPSLQARTCASNNFRLKVMVVNANGQMVATGQNIGDIGGPIGFKPSSGGTTFTVENGNLKTVDANGYYACLPTKGTILPSGTVVVTDKATCAAQGGQLLDCSITPQYLLCSAGNNIRMQQCGQFLNLASTKQTRDGCGDLISLSYVC